jgi:hypothetical protein
MPHTYNGVMSEKRTYKLGKAAQELGRSRTTLLRWCIAAFSDDPAEREASPFARMECFRAGRDWTIYGSAIERIKAGLPKPESE